MVSFKNVAKDKRTHCIVQRNKKKLSFFLKTKQWIFWTSNFTEQSISLKKSIIEGKGTIILKTNEFRLLMND